jgi:hypothetical protein
MNVLAISLVEEIKNSRQQTHKAVSQLAERLHQVQLLLEREPGNKDAIKLLAQALHQCEAITLSL